MEEKPKRRWMVLKRFFATVLVVGALYVPSVGPAMFFYPHARYEGVYSTAVRALYGPLFSYLGNHPDSWLADYMNWWGRLGESVLGSQ